MKKKNNFSDDFKYPKEHLACANYVSAEQAILGITEVKAGKYLIREDIERHVLIFILSGEIDISTADSVCQRINEKQMFLICAGDSFHGKAITDISLMHCAFTRELSLCNRFSLELLQNYIPSSYRQEKHGLTLLSIHDLLLKELEVTHKILQTGISCIHFQNLKKEILFIELRGLYTKEDLARLFAPILGMDNDFKDRILQIYSQVETSQELIDKMNMSPSVFKRKFRETFGISARQ